MIDDPFGTETMAELCVRQGKIGEAAAIYRQLADAASDTETRARRQARLSEIETMTPDGGSVAPRQTESLPRPGQTQDGRVRRPTPAPIAVPTAPGIIVHRTGDDVTLAWALPPGMPDAALQVVVITAGRAGPETRRELIRIDAPLGLRALAVPGALRVLAAAGRIDGERFVPLVHAQQTV